MDIFRKLNKSNRRIVIAAMIGLLLLMVGNLVWSVDHRQEERSLSAPTLTVTEEPANDADYKLSWDSEEYVDSYDVVRYSKTTKEYIPYKTGIKDSSITIPKETGKYKVKAKLELVDNTLEVESNNEVEITVPVDKAKTYSDITIIKTYHKNDFNKIANVEGKDKTTHAQSICCVKDGLVVALVNRGNSQGRLEKFDFGGDFVKAVDTSSLGHANGCTYNPIDDRLYIMKAYSRSKSREVRAFDSDLKEYKSVNIKKSPSGVGFDRETENYCFTAGPRIYIADSDMNVVKTHKRLRHHRSQDVCGYNGVAMSCIWTGGSNSFIDLYREDDGAYLGSYDVSLGEIESICIHDGYLYMLYNGGNIYCSKERFVLP